MELDDLKSPECHWSCSPPNVLPSEVHIAVWEKVFTAPHPLLTPEPSKPNTAELSIVEDVKVAKYDFTSVLNIDCNTTVSLCKDITSHGLLSPPLRSSVFSPLRGRTSSLVLPQKTKAGQFEPYVPRKKRLISQSCPNSPLNNSDIDMSPVPSPKFSQSFLTWQDIREQSKKTAVEDLQSDSGYSSPASVSSCGSLPFGQSNLSASVRDHAGDLHVPEDKKANDGGQTDHLCSGSCNCKDLTVSSGFCSSQRKNTDLLHEAVDSLDLADELEQLLPDCLLENPRSLVNPCTTNNVLETKLENFVELSAEQDQFILDILAV